MRFSGWILGLAACLGAVGCADDGAVDGRPQTVPVSGRVLHNGQPLEGATITFHPPVTVPGEAASQPSAFGTTDANGQFQLTTFSAQDGAVPGEYRVSVSKYETPPLTGTGGTSEGEPEGYVPPGPGAAPATPKSLIPEKFANPATSELTATVSAEGPNEFTFELK